MLLACMFSGLTTWHWANNWRTKNDFSHSQQDLVACVVCQGLRPRWPPAIHFCMYIGVILVWLTFGSHVSKAVYPENVRSCTHASSWSYNLSVPLFHNVPCALGVVVLFRSRGLKFQNCFI